MLTVNAEIDRLLEEAAPDAFRTILSAAQYANVAAAQWILNRVAPARKGRAVILDDFPSIDGPDDIAPALSAIAAAVADGELSIEEASLAADVLQKFLERKPKVEAPAAASHGPLFEYAKPKTKVADAKETEPSAESR